MEWQEIIETQTMLQGPVVTITMYRTTQILPRRLHVTTVAGQCFLTTEVPEAAAQKIFYKQEKIGIDNTNWTNSVRLVLNRNDVYSI